MAAGLRQLRYFLAAVEAGSVTRAAERLAVAQPALGLQIRKLEEEFGTKLLRRHSRGVEPTEAGRVLAARAEAVLREVEALHAAMRQAAREPGGRVVLGMTPGIANLFGTRLLDRARAALPRVQVAFTEGLSAELVEQLVEGRLDLALLYDPPGNRRGLRGIALAEEDLRFIHRPEAGAPVPEGEIRLAEMARHPIALPGLVEHALVRRIFAAAAQAGCHLQVAGEVTSVATLRAMLLAGRCATAMPFGTYLPEIRAGLLRAPRIADPPITRRLSLAYSDRRPLSVAEGALRDLIRDEIRRGAEGEPGLWRPLRPAAQAAEQHPAQAAEQHPAQAAGHDVAQAAGPGAPPAGETNEQQEEEPHDDETVDAVAGRPGRDGRRRGAGARPGAGPGRELA